MKDFDKEMEFFDTCPRPTHCTYCGAEMKPSEDPTLLGLGGFNMGGIDDLDTFFGTCLKCGKLSEVVMTPENYDEETLAEFREHGFMLDPEKENFLSFVIRHAINRWRMWRMNH